MRQFAVVFADDGAGFGLEMQAELAPTAIKGCSDAIVPAGIDNLSGKGELAPRCPVARLRFTAEPLCGDLPRSGSVWLAQVL